MEFLMNPKKALSEIKQAASIEELNALTGEDVKAILTKVSKGELDALHVEALIATNSNFIPLAQKALKTQIEIAKAVKACQSEALQVMQTTVGALADALQTLADKAETDEARIHIATCIVEAAKIFALTAQNMNQDNNETWKAVATTLGLLLLSTLAGVAGAFAVGPSNSSNHKP